MIKTSPFNSGLNNQKISLLGYALIALRTNNKLILPTSIFDFTPGKMNQLIHINKVFNIRIIENILDKYNLKNNLEVTKIIENNPSDMFRLGATALAKLDQNAIENEKGFIEDFLKSFKPNDAIQVTIKKIISDLKITTSLQLRIEKDWINYLKKRNSLNNLMPHEEIPLCAESIFEKIRGTEALCNLKKIYICCDEDDLSKDINEVKAKANMFDMELIFKENILKLGIQLPESRLIRSVIDFEIALESQSFIGLSRSTFSNLVCFCRNYSRDDKADHYIYNIKGSMLGLRLDDGCLLNPQAITNNIKK